MSWLGYIWHYRILGGSTTVSGGAFVGSSVSTPTGAWWDDARKFTLQVLAVVAGALITYFVVTRHHERFKSRQSFALELAKAKAKFLGDIVGRLETYHRAVDWVSVGSMNETHKIAKQRQDQGKPLSAEQVQQGLQHGFDDYDRLRKEQGKSTLLQQRTEILDMVREAYFWLDEADARLLERRFRSIADQEDRGRRGEVAEFAKHRDGLLAEAKPLYDELKSRLFRA